MDYRITLRFSKSYKYGINRFLMQKPQNSLIEKGIRKRYCLHPVDNPLRSDRPDIKNTRRLLLIMKKPRGTIYNRQTVGSGP